MLQSLYRRTPTLCRRLSVPGIRTLKTDGTQQQQHHETQEAQESGNKKATGTLIWEERAYMCVNYNGTCYSETAEGHY